jgi:hypothetical protein
MSIISNSLYSPEILNVGGEFMTAFLIIVLIMSLFLTDTKYWGEFTSSTFNVSFNPLLLVFLAIVIFEIMIYMM